MTASTPPRGKRRPRQWLLVAIVAIAMPGALVGCGDDESDDESAATNTVTTATTATAPTEPAQTLQDARTAVDEDDYATAVTIATAIGVNEANAIRRRISNRIARRSFAALRAGNRGLARSLVIEGKRYPTTQQSVRARASYKSAKARAAARARQRRQEAVARRRAREQAEQAPPPPPPSADSPDVPSGATCADTSKKDFPVPPGDPRDRDGDGIGCES